MEKIKQFMEENAGKDLLTVLIIILVGLGSFGLGRLSKTTKDAGITVEYVNPPQIISSNAISALDSIQGNQVEQSSRVITSKVQNGAYFASNRGSKYYSIGCSGGKTLKPENKIYFQTKDEAEKAGYEISSTCK